MTVKITAPTRIDLAGGTLDIFPLYIFEEGGITVNIAITLPTYTEIEVREDSRISIYSKDMDLKVTAENWQELLPEGKQELLIRAVRFFAPQFGMDITTESRAPHGSGLAASSALLVGLMYGLANLCNQQTNPNAFIDRCANVEARSLGIPTGKQDYYSAYFGGISKINFQDSGITHEHADVPKSFNKLFEDVAILSFTGISHYSGTNNWNMMKSYIDNEGRTRECMKKIKETAEEMWEAVTSQDINKIAKALNREWENRKMLAEGVTNETIERIIAKAKDAGALASKICGAGGGGSLLTICDPKNRAKVEAAIRDAGAEILNFNVSTDGVVLRKNNI